MASRTTDNRGIVITQTPLRVSFFGGATDFPIYFNKSNGLVLGAAINQYIYVSINYLERLLENRIRLSYSKVENVNSVDEINHEIIKEIFNYDPIFSRENFIDIHTFADLPASSGLGSSSSFTVGILNGLYLLNKIDKSKIELAKEAIHVERNMVKSPGGWQDQIFASYGGINVITFKSNDFDIKPIDLQPNISKELEESCILLFTGKLRSSSAVQKTFKYNFTNKTEKYLDAMKEIVQEALDLLNKEESSNFIINKFGELLDKSWGIKQSLTTKITNPYLNSIYTKGLNAGALGGKICGAGSGGFMLFIVPKSKRKYFHKEMSKFVLKNVKIDYLGSKCVYKRK